MPLNDFQFMFWIADIVEPKVKKLNVAGRKRLQGSININALQNAFEAIFKRQEIFSIELVNILLYKNYTKRILLKLRKLIFLH